MDMFLLIVITIFVSISLENSRENNLLISPFEKGALD